MSTLEKILHEIDKYENTGILMTCPGWVKEILEEHLSDNDRMINIDDEHLWKILFEEACVEGQQAERIHKRLEEICGNGWIACSERLPGTQTEIL